MMGQEQRCCFYNSDAPTHIHTSQSLSLPSWSLRNGLSPRGFMDVILLVLELIYHTTRGKKRGDLYSVGERVGCRARCIVLPCFMAQNTCEGRAGVGLLSRSLWDRYILGGSLHFGGMSSHMHRVTVFHGTV